MTIHNNFQSIKLSDFTSSIQIDTVMKMKSQEAQAIANPGKKVKVGVGMYFYLPINGDAVFTISTYGDDYPTELKDMWRVESAKPNTDGDYDDQYTLKEAIANLEREYGSCHVCGRKQPHNRLNCYYCREKLDKE